MTATADLADLTASAATLHRFLHGLPGVDQVGVEARAAGLATRSIKTTAKQFALDLAVSMIDLTTLEGQDTAGKVRALCAKGRRPDPSDPSCPAVAAICVYGDLVPVAVEALAGSGIHVAAVATAFPSGRAPLEVKLADVRAAVEAGADEIDMVIDRGAFLAGRYLDVHDEIVATKQACGDAHLVHAGQPVQEPAQRGGRRREVGEVGGRSHPFRLLAGSGTGIRAPRPGAMLSRA